MFNFYTNRYYYVFFSCDIRSIMINRSYKKNIYSDVSTRKKFVNSHAADDIHYIHIIHKQLEANDLQSALLSKLFTLFQVHLFLAFSYHQSHISIEWNACIFFFSTITIFFGKLGTNRCSYYRLRKMIMRKLKSSFLAENCSFFKQITMKWNSICVHDILYKVHEVFNTSAIVQLTK